MTNVHYGVVNFEGQDKYFTLASNEDNDCIFDQLRGMIIEEVETE